VADPSNPSAQDVAAAVTARVRRLLAAADGVAREVHRRAEREAAEHLETRRTEIDAFARERLDRIASLTDRLLDHAELLERRAEQATSLPGAIDRLVEALAAAADAIAAEAERTLPPRRPRPPLRPVGEPDPEAAEHVREAAALLPPRPVRTPRPARPSSSRDD
jgi:hypothetical protein